MTEYPISKSLSVLNEPVGAYRNAYLKTPFSTIPIDPSWSFSDKTIKDTAYISHGYYTYPAKFIQKIQYTQTICIFAYKLTIKCLVTKI